MNENRLSGLNKRQLSFELYKAINNVNEYMCQHELLEPEMSVDRRVKLESHYMDHCEVNEIREAMKCLRV